MDETSQIKKRRRGKILNKQLLGADRKKERATGSTGAKQDGFYILVVRAGCWPALRLGEIYMDSLLSLTDHTSPARLLGRQTMAPRTIAQERSLQETKSRSHKEGGRRVLANAGECCFDGKAWHPLFPHQGRKVIGGDPMQGKHQEGNWISAKPTGIGGRPNWAGWRHHQWLSPLTACC